MRERLSERGFTIVELMIVVAIVAVLAIVVVPSFMKESSRGKAKSEVHPVFAELVSKQDAYKSEFNTYLATPACPATVNKQGTDVVTTPCSTWTALRVQPPQQKLMCSYAVTIGDAGTLTGVPTWVTDLATPGTSWYFIHAVCPDTEYFTASWDTKIRSKDGQ